MIPGIILLSGGKGPFIEIEEQGNWQYAPFCMARMMKKR